MPVEMLQVLEFVVRVRSHVTVDLESGKNVAQVPWLQQDRLNSASLPNAKRSFRIRLVKSACQS